MAVQDVQSVSVVIPCYNGMPYLPEALDSARQQTHRPLEIIVVDDGSSDRSAATVREYAQRHRDANVCLIQQANGGEPVARNAGIEAAGGTWIAALDTDDWWEPDKLAKQLAAAEAAGPECVLVHTGVTHELPDGSSQPRDMSGAARRVGWATEALLENTSMGHPSILVRRDALARIGGYDPSFKQACDIDLYWRLSTVGTFAFVPEHLLHYRIHPGQMSRRPAEQVGYHHRAVRNFFQAHPDKEREIGREKIDAALAEHLAGKLESLYWRRRLDQFRQLLAYADESELDSPKIAELRRRARVPNWLIRAKDLVTSRGGS